MKKLLNQFAKWLYRKTRQPIPEDWGQLFTGYKVMRSKVMPPDTIMFGSDDYVKLSDFFLDKEIKV